LSDVPPPSVRVVSEIEELERLSEPWRELAHACACPAALPGWQLAWWHHLAPAGALLRAVVVFEQDRLIGLAPCFVNPGRRVDYRLLGGGMTHRVSPLASPGREREVASLVASALAGCDPRPDLVALEAIDASSRWVDEIRDAWPGKLRPWRYTSSSLSALVVDLKEGTFDSWFASRSRKFREVMRRAGRDIEKAGGRVVLATDRPATDRAIDAFVLLHLARMSARGGSSLTGEWSRMLKDATASLAASGEMRLWVLKIGEKLAAVNVILAAGGVLAGFNIGFDEDFAKLEPGHVTTLAAIEDAFARGEVRLDLGGGDSAYKRRLASRDLPVVWTGIVPRTRRYPLTRIRLAPDQARWLITRIGRRLPSAWRREIKRIARRG
jgi:CelD/BcsL family acetyltransferase involved in cellulose biosynthesis